MNQTGTSHTRAGHSSSPNSCKSVRPASAMPVQQAETCRSKSRFPPASFRPAQHVCRAIQRLGQHRQLLRRPAAVLRVQCLVHSGNHHRRVAGKLSGRVDRVPVPGTIGQTGLRNQRRLRLPQSLVQLRQVARPRSFDPMRLFRCRREPGRRCLAAAKSTDRSFASPALRLAASRYSAICRAYVT